MGTACPTRRLKEYKEMIKLLFQRNPHNTKKYYRSKKGRYYFNFEFINTDSHIDIFCRNHPPLNGRDSDVVKTHLFSSGKICFVSGKEPRTQARAEQLAAQFAEYYANYILTGETAS